MSGSPYARLSLDGRVIAITGATGGIGAAAARLCAARGASVVLADLDAEKGRLLASEIEGRGGQAAFVRTDVSCEDDVAAMVAFAVERFGGLHGAFNNAGVNTGNALIADKPLDDWQRGIAINLTGVFLCLKHQIRHMAAHGGGAIVNTSSTAGAVGMPWAPDYVASKHGVLGITKAAATEVSRQGIRVNAILPGAVETAMFTRALDTNPTLRDLTEAGHPIGRIAQAGEMAETVAWLLSDAASYITGACIAADGGFTAQ